ncbi:MAG: DNA double-strand break repair nuclease NurA [Firmicutes bacterium]|nr:DNA double-strand break repair nuclease NurA [Bacillota bacterium]
MLDLNKLYAQIASLGKYQISRIHDLAKAFGLADEQIRLVSENIEAFKSKVNRSTTSWLVAIPTDEEPFQTHQPPLCPSSYAVLSTDGSQITPDRHSPYRAYLINIGKVEIGYGDFLGYKFESEPNLFFEEKDIKRRFGGKERDVSGAVLAALRGKMESDALAEMIKNCKRRPTVALTDGTLILWSLEADSGGIKGLETDDLKMQSFLSLMNLISTGKETGIPIAGYISAPGSSDVVNALRVSLCPSDPVNCDNCPYRGAGFDGALPCAKIDGITDAELFRRLLQIGERSSLFGSISKILEDYGEEKIYFFYLNVGYEIARIEVPGWVARDSQAIELVHATCLDQADKGAGYPIAVAEAHEQAVVKSTDKNMFDQLVLQALIREGSPVIESRKSLRKKGGFV